MKVIKKHTPRKYLFTWLMAMKLLMLPTEGLPLPTDSNKLIEKLKARLREEEGLRLKAYKPDASEKHYTIGYGHYGEDVGENEEISEDRAEELLDQDIRSRVEQIRNSIQSFDTFPESMKEALFSSWYRGSLPQSKNTINLINESKFQEASNEFLNNDEYRDRKSGKRKQLGGVIKRMENTSNELKKQGENIKAKGSYYGGATKNQLKELLKKALEQNEENNEE